MTQPFWMLYIEGQRGPTFKHASEATARQEAERLAKLIPGKKVYLLEAKAECLVQTSNWTNYEELPF